MLEDKLLVWRLKQGSSEALERIYGKYKDDLLGLAIALAQDRATAEDAVHDVFVSLVEYAGRLGLRGSLKSYLSSSVANRVRNIRKSKSRQAAALDEAAVGGSRLPGPDGMAMAAEKMERIRGALDELPYEQREVMMLHQYSGMSFKAIAVAQSVSINTVQSRYRYGLDKLRTLLNGEVET